MTIEALLAHPDVERLAQSLRESPGRRVEAQPPVRWAAIAVVLRLGDLDQPELLMIKRAEAERDPWSGHVACPGGRMEPADRDLEQTAVRETWEETGIDLARTGKVLGALDDVSPRTPTLPPIVIRPFVAAVPSSVELVQSQEVAQAFWVPFHALREQGAWGTSTIIVRGTERSERTFTHGEFRVWGLTERVLSQLLERLD